MSKTIILAGGGTGGHVYPALAMGEALVARGYRLVYFGDAGRLEGRVVPSREIPFVPIPALQYPRSGLVAKVKFAVGLLRAVAACRTLLKEHRADFVLGVGGYISAPPVLAAFTLGIPRAVHEANVTPGLANKLCAMVADLVFLAYEATANRLPGNAPRHVVGCPVSPKIMEGDARAAAKRYGLNPKKPTVLVVGGSLGAATLNAVAEALVRADGRSYQVVWVTGPTYEADAREKMGVLPKGTALVGYENRMPDAYALADLVVARAGSSTLAELTMLGKPSILIPSPNVTENHQEGNARGLEGAGAAVVFVEQDFDAGPVVTEAAAILGDVGRRKAMGAGATSLAKPDTAARVAEAIAPFLE